MKRTITTRSQCLAAATEDARDWAQQSVTEEHQLLCDERGYRAEIRREIERLRGVAEAA